jgi:methylmalonyl-CoA/ethylmalonyl-CoA epimerase
MLAPDQEERMSDALSRGLGLGAPDQVAYVVADLDAALPHYEALFGPFRVSEAALPDCEIRGERTSCKLKLAVNTSGPIEIELIQPLEGDPPHAWHLREHGEGLHHVRFRTDALEETLERLGAAGYERIFYKRFGPAVAFAYMTAPKEIGGSIVELLEMP